MIKRSLVSVITIFLNTEKFIGEAIESVFAQTYKHWELLLVDDGSTDASTSIARRYTTENPDRVRYLEHPAHRNQGMSASRNLGIRQAYGKYIAFLDADDVWLPHKLDQQVAIMDMHPEVGMLYGKTEYWYSWTGDPKDQQRDNIPELGVNPDRVVGPPHLLPMFLEGSASVPCTCSVLVRREALERSGGFEKSFIKLYEDQVFYVKLCLREPVFVASACWDKYRQHSDASVAIARKTGQDNHARQFFLEWMVEYLLLQEVRNPEIWRALHRQLWLNRQATRLNLPAWFQILMRITIKWLLRLEARIVPAQIRDWFWSRG